MYISITIFICVMANVFHRISHTFIFSHFPALIYITCFILWFLGLFFLQRFLPPLDNIGEIRSENVILSFKYVVLRCLLNFRCVDYIDKVTIIIGESNKLFIIIKQ